MKKKERVEGGGRGGRERPSSGFFNSKLQPAETFLFHDVQSTEQVGHQFLRTTERELRELHCG